ncbi:hypothetical protein RhiirC2_800439 [Rhizophagus irregularis]|uniref:Uncharacterized protein n=1 Tax=Rhizophagus irregularis TaxID=588596 RepID=A0A2N1M3P8_9GLOM|nr:hypothetical protein RhiirC2_800439 [Rhizophagus irregularis]
MSTSPASTVNPVATTVQRRLITKGRFFHTPLNEDAVEYSINASEKRWKNMGFHEICSDVNEQGTASIYFPLNPPTDWIIPDG